MTPKVFIVVDPGQGTPVLKGRLLGWVVYSCHSCTCPPSSSVAAYDLRLLWYLCGPLIRWHQLVNPANSAFWEPQWLHYVCIKLGIITALLASTGHPDGHPSKPQALSPRQETTTEEVCAGQSYILCTLCANPMRPGWLPASERSRETSGSPFMLEVWIVIQYLPVGGFSGCKLHDSMYFPSSWYTAGVLRKFPKVNLLTGCI